MEADEWAAYFDVQARSCTHDGSPLYGALISRLGEDYAAGGIVAELLEDWTGNPISDAVAMRILGAVHYLVLTGQAAELARHYPSAGGRPVHPGVGDLLISTLAQHRAFVAGRLREQVQTNEVRRSVALLGGFLAVSAETGLPLRLLEIGASAGLNQLWHRHRYELGPHRWGDPASPLVLTTEWHGKPPDLEAPVRVSSRRACDLHPVDLSNADSRRRLEGFIWPDQPERRERFLRAADAVVAEGVVVERASALQWLEARLAEPGAGAATVLFHSVMWLYLDHDERAGITALMERVGQSSHAEAPLAWLRMEAKSFTVCELRLQLWPNGEDRLLGTCGFHGQTVEWNG